jgi:hypothetical protein
MRGEPPADGMPLRPADFCRLFLAALAAAEGRKRRRKRDQTPDTIGLELKRTLLERAIAADPEPADFEAWLLAQTLSASAAGPVRAMCGEILHEYRIACVDPDYGRWLAAGAYSADAEE